MQVKIPQLGLTMTEGTLAEWLVADGADVAEGAPLYTLENDKTENEIAAPISGRLRQIGVVGETYDVGTVIAEIEE